jgi:hypothetical protein
VAGDCFCFGAVVDRRSPGYKNLPIYLSVAGPSSSVDAVWAKLAQGKEVTIVPDDKNAAAIYLQPNAAGLYTRFQRKIETVGIDHLILIHEDAAEVDYSDLKDAPTTYLLCTSTQQKIAKLGDIVRHVVKIAVFDPWLDYVYEEGLRRGLVRGCISYGVKALAVKLDVRGWTAVITEGLAGKQIAFPNSVEPVSIPVQPQAVPSLADQLRELLHDTFLSYYGKVDETLLGTLTQELSDCATAMTSYIDFWRRPTLELQLQSKIKVMLDDHDFLSDDRLGVVVERIMNLLRSEAGEPTHLPALPAADNVEPS